MSSKFGPVKKSKIYRTKNIKNDISIYRTTSKRYIEQIKTIYRNQNDYYQNQKANGAKRLTILMMINCDWPCVYRILAIAGTTIGAVYWPMDISYKSEAYN